MDIFIGLLILSAIGFGIYFILHLLISYLTKDSTIDGIFNWFRVINRKIYETRVKKIKNHPKVKAALSDFISAKEEFDETVIKNMNLSDFEELVDIYPDKKSEFIEEIKVFNPSLHKKITEKAN